MPLLDQTCPHCGITEAAGSYCTSCERSTRPEWVHEPIKGHRDLLRLKAMQAGKVAARATRQANVATGQLHGPRSAKEGTA
jgi:hypothetical protein